MSRPTSSAAPAVLRWLALAAVLLGLAAPATDRAAPGRPELRLSTYTVGPQGDLPRSFRVATFNVLGASHTDAGGDKAGYPEWPERMNRTLDLIAARGFDVVGFQELQEPQYDYFKDRTDRRWGFHPAKREGTWPLQNSVGWRRSMWEAVERHTVDIPYFGGRLLPMPYVLLRHRATGEQAWFLNVHNPARPENAEWRRRAIRKEAALVVRLQESGTPVIFTGDLNDREKAFCPFMRLAPQMRATNGGSHSGDTCRPPERMHIDWIFLSQFLASSNHTVLDNRNVDKITDHRVIYADIGLP